MAAIFFGGDAFNKYSAIAILVNGEFHILLRFAFRKAQLRKMPLLLSFYAKVRRKSVLTF